MGTTIHQDETSEMPEKEQHYRVKLIILSGRSGSGKSTTAFEICHVLRLRKIMHVHIDGDNLDAMYPREDEPDSGLMIQNLRVAWKNFWGAACHWWTERGWASKGRKTFVVVIDGTAIVMKTNAIKDVITKEIQDTPGGADWTSSDQVTLETFPIILEASEEVVDQRLRRRELGGELDEALSSTRKMAGVLKSWSSEPGQESIWISSQGREVNSIAQEIIGLCRIE